MPMKITMDLVKGHELDSAIRAGQVTRMALITGVPVPAGDISDPFHLTALLPALIASGLPDKGTPYDIGEYRDWFLKRHILRAFDSTTVGVEMVYQFLGIRIVQDSSSLASVPTQLHPRNFKPLEVHYKPTVNGVDGPEVIKPVTLQGTLPLRHLTITQTIDFMAGPDVLDAFGSVNQLPWQGLDPGYWLLSGLSGETQDDGITYTYSATFSTKQKEDWSQMGFIEDDNGRPIHVDPDLVAALRGTPYAYDVDTSVNGVLKAGLHPMADFYDIFGV